jgi:hypothetical protein
MRSLLILTAGVLALIGIGVGSVAAAGKAHLAVPSTSHTTSVRGSLTSATGMCGEINSITGAVVRRVVSLPANHPRFSIPPVIEVSSAAAAQRVAELICSLPKFPPGMFSCPVDVGIGYHVDFILGRSSTSVALDPWGCETARGAISVRSAGSAAFWHGLGSAIGMTAATRSTFAGTIPGSGARILP